MLGTTPGRLLAEVLADWGLKALGGSGIDYITATEYTAPIREAVSVVSPPFFRVL